MSERRVIEINIDGSLNENEANVIVAVAKRTEERLLLGLQEYGSLEFVGEKADEAFWQRQFTEELDDLATYRGILDGLKAHKEGQR